MRKNNQTGRILPKWGANKKVNNFLWRTVQMCRYFLTTCTNKLHEDKNIKQMSCSTQEIGRSLLPKCSSDAKIFSSDVYKKSTQARKYQADGLQYGRSMVEMLGVLAIIGVLSVGAIAGYQKAMTKYKLNKQAEQLNTIINAMLRYKTTFLKNNCEPSSTIHNLFNKLGEIPKEMIKQGDNYLYDAYNNKLNLLLSGSTTTLSGDLTCTSLGMSYQLSNQFDNYDLCLNIFNVIKEYKADIMRTTMSATNASSDGQSFYGDKYCYTGRTCLNNLSLDDIYNQCQWCKEKEGCKIWFSFYINDSAK